MDKALMTIGRSLTALCLSLRNMPELVLEWEEAPKRFESIGISKYTVKRVACSSNGIFQEFLWLKENVWLMGAGRCHTSQDTFVDDLL
jgi:hypothetical protein